MNRRAIFYVGLLVAPVYAGAFEINCPDTIANTQTLLTEVSGWKEFIRPSGSAKDRNLSHVAGIALYSGDPKDIAQLKPDDENARQQTWSFGSPASPQYPLVMACIYFETRMQFTKELPLNTKKCTANDGALRCEEFRP